MEHEAVAMIERLSGRKVTSFLSDHDPVNDVAVELFVLAPCEDDLSGQEPSGLA
jgi:uncharacterized protein YbcI